MRGLVLELAEGYGVQHIFGFRYGYEGLVARFGHAPLRLTPESVARVHHHGGTILGSSRGSQDPAVVVDNLQALGIDLLFVIGGDGTIRGAMAITAEIARRGSKIGVVGVPKTIDNDIHFIDRSFGFESAYSAAVEVIRSAHVEATGAHDGIGLVKLMGRHSGFVACHAALASTDVDLVLVPEVPRGARGPARRAAATSSACSTARGTRWSSSPRARPRRSWPTRPPPAAPTRAATRASRTSACSSATASPRTSSRPSAR